MVLEANLSNCGLAEKLRERPRWDLESFSPLFQGRMDQESLDPQSLTHEQLQVLAAKSLRIRVGLKVGTADLPWSRNNAEVIGLDA